MMNNVAPLPATAHSRFRRIVLGLLAFVFFLAVAGMIYENIFESRDRRFNPMTGSRFDVGGFKMHIDCTGEGSPTVILDSGLGDTYLSWLKVQPQVAKFTRVCSYDRAGLGYSESSSQPRTSKVIATELRALLQAAGIVPPYVLVGHSVGGFNVRLYASLYRSDVAGMVLVDSSHPAQVDRLPAGFKDMHADWTRKAQFREYTMLFGLPRLLDQCNEDPVLRAAGCNWHTAVETVAELKSFQESAAQTAATGSLGDMPLFVLSHDPNKRLGSFPAGIAKPANEAWEKMQEELAHLSARGTQVIAAGSSHSIPLDRPDVVVEGIRNVVEQVRAAQAAAPSKLN
jgi:pimeloyl-ACP methyl ester carboxylesterase